MMLEQEEKAAEVLAKLVEKVAEKGEAILGALEKIIYLEKSGILDELVSYAELITGLRKLPEEMMEADVQDVLSKNLEIVLSLALSIDDEMIQRVEKIVEAFRQAKDFEPVGFTGAMRAMRDPEVQKALGFLIAFARNLGKNL